MGRDGCVKELLSSIGRYYLAISLPKLKLIFLGFQYWCLLRCDAVYNIRQILVELTASIVRLGEKALS